MQYTLHLTNACNLACAYCRQPKSKAVMNIKTAQKTVDIALADTSPSIGIGFYGGEPLLCKDLIKQIIQYTRINNFFGKKVFFKLTTNGLLLDDAFLQYAKQENILISLSLDGNKTAHDMNRNDSYNKLTAIIPMLLKHNPYTAIMMTLAPNTVEYFYDSVKSIYGLGFMNIIVSMDYGGNWQECHLIELKKQYKTIATLYYEYTIAEKKFFFSPLDSKINSHIHRSNYREERCKLGYEQLSVGVDGTLYPCIQFAGNDEYQIGDVFSETGGINQSRRDELHSQSRSEQPECKGCAVRERCMHTCSCMNMAATGNISKPSPALCAVERVLIPIADEVAAKLYKKRNGMFIHKHYNEFYPLISLTEDNRISKQPSP